jgi:A/G-specific adenine glycosylase
MIHKDDPLKKFHTLFAKNLAVQSFSPAMLEVFCNHIWDFYRKQGRVFAWRETADPYAIVVSEVMLQQTQTQRVIEKFDSFTKEFKDFHELAAAPARAVLAQWVGLGYNRRGLALHSIAQKVVNEFDGILPDDPEVLQTFKGLGPATSASIVAFAFNKPTVFIETNIRAVYLHTFYNNQEYISDKELMPLIDLTVDQANAREWYYALMDYGVVLKKLYKNPSRKSKHHTTQSKFEGSDRQIRGAIVRMLTQKSSALKKDFESLFPGEGERVKKILSDLCKEGFVVKKTHTYELSG